jgi:hypothetical protein
MTMRILYVEDSEIVACVMIPTLKTLGEVRHCANLLDGLRGIGWCTHVITDWNLDRGQDAEFLVRNAKALGLGVVVCTSEDPDLVRDGRWVPGPTQAASRGEIVLAFEKKS